LIASALVLGPASERAAAQGPGAAKAAEPRGLRLKTGKAMPGYVVFSPLLTDTAYLVDIDGQVIRSWKSDYRPSGWVYLLPNGHLLRGANDTGTTGFSGGGAGGRIQEFDFDGKLVWDFSFASKDHLSHHDVALLPNGNIVVIAWERKSAEEARRAGRRPGFIPETGVWPDMLVELQPQPPNSARIVWEWHAWDHRIQNIDASLELYGDPAQHPEKFDLNGDLIGTGTPPRNPTADILHTNSVFYNPALDQLILSVPRFNEVWVVDHSTTTREAAGSSGGRSGKGGDLLYRWGNPQAYGRGTAADRLLGFQHDARWILDGLPGAGHMSVFSNRTPGAKEPYTKVYELVPPVDDHGRYAIAAGKAFGPAEPVWTYSAPGSFDATYISGAQRLSSGNTFVTSGPQGRFFEVTPSGEIVWEYWSPFRGEGTTGGGNGAANPYSAFRGQKVPPDYPGLRGHDLRPR
jgi:hypothetical protein